MAPGAPCSRSTCRYCGAPTAAVCGLEGLGAGRRRHERRCSARLALLDTPSSSVLLRSALLEARGGPGLRTAAPAGAPLRAGGPAPAAGGSLGVSAPRGASGPASPPGGGGGAPGGPPSAPTTAEALVALAPVAYLVVGSQAMLLVWATGVGLLLGRRARRPREGSALQPALPPSRAPSAAAPAAGAPAAAPASGGSGGAGAAVAAQGAPGAAALVRELRVQAALEAAAAGAAGAGAEADWLRRLGPAARAGLEATQVPPVGAGWQGPLESSGPGWSIVAWYRWTGPTSVAAVCQIPVNADLASTIALWQEADLMHNWVPFTSAVGCTWSDSLPALLLRIRTKVPILPMTFGTLVHRAFVDVPGDGSRPHGVLIVDWTPGPEELSDGQYCGMGVPGAPAGTQMDVQLASTVVQPLDERRSNVVITNEIDLKVSRWLLPDAVLRKFLVMQSRVMAKAICRCAEAAAEHGYGERVRQDARGLYAALQGRFRGARAAAAGA